MFVILVVLVLIGVRIVGNKNFSEFGGHRVNGLVIDLIFGEAGQAFGGGVRRINTADVVVLVANFSDAAGDFDDADIGDGLAAREIDCFIGMQRNALHFDVNQTCGGKAEGNLIR